MGHRRRSSEMHRGVLTSLGLLFALGAAPAASAAPASPPQGPRAAALVRRAYDDHRRTLRLAQEAADEARRAARDATIARLEAEASPSPEALLERATLTEARARESDAAHRAADLDKAIALDQRFLRAFPDRPEIARVTLSLGRALAEAGRRPEALAVWRSLVCHDRFPSTLPLSKDPYPADCQPLPAARDAALLAEAWRLIGDSHFAAGEPLAEAAYRHTLSGPPQPARAAAMARLAAIALRDRRYEASIHQLIDLLRASDEEERTTGAAPTDLLLDAYADLAEALASLSSSDGDALQKVEDAALIPQDARWTFDIYQALFRRYTTLNQPRRAIAVGERIAAKWPGRRDNWFIQAEIAGLYDALASQAKEGSPERAASREAAIAARMKLTTQLETGWGPQEKLDPAEIQAVEELLRRSLRRVAVDRTTGGSALLEEAAALSAKAPRDKALERSLAEYQRAAAAWSGYLAQDENAADAPDTMYWLADAYHRMIVIEVALGRAPAAEAIEGAQKAATRARDAAKEDAFLRGAAFFLVDIAEQALSVEYALFERTHGAQGIERRAAVKTTGEGEHLKVVSEPLPKAVLAAVAARDAYVKHVPPAADVNRDADRLTFEAANLYFLYGQFAEARPRFRPLYVGQCGKSEVGYKAWERLITMASLENNIDEARKLAEEALKKSCAISPTDPSPGPFFPPHNRGLVDAYAAFEKAMRMPGGPERDKQWREAGELYRQALAAGPARDEAPEAAINGAYAYRQVGAYAQALALYTLFIKEYGSEPILTALEKGDPKQSPPRPADPRRYAERVRYLKEAYDALGVAEVLSFDYPAAAETYAAIARSPRFPGPGRLDAAQNAVILYLTLGDRGQATASWAAIASLKPSPERKAEVEYLFAAAELKAWDERGPDEGQNRDARRRAMAAMDRYLADHQGIPAASGHVVEAAYQSARLRRAGHDAGAAAWCRKAVAAFERSDPKKGSAQADMAAECAYTLLDEEIQVRFDKRPSLPAAAAYAAKLQAIIDRFGSRALATAARARQAELYEACWSLHPAPASETEAEALMLRYSIEALRWAKVWRIWSPALERAARRLASLTQSLGDARLRAASQGIIDPETKAPFVYTEGMFTRARPGMTAFTPGSLTAPALPVLP